MLNLHTSVQVLLVDDEKFSHRLIEKMLPKPEFEITDAYNATEGLEFFRTRNFDVILLDMVMTGINGLEARELFRKQNRELPIIFLTAMVDDINNTLLNIVTEDSYTYYINKNRLHADTLIAKIREVVDMRLKIREQRRYLSEIETSLNFAANIQNSLLPDWITAAGSSAFVSTLYRPLQSVSGDLFDIVPLPMNRCLVFTGDVAGHGIEGALYTTVILGYLKSMREELGKMSPDEVLNSMNEFFCQVNYNSETRYLTAIVALFDFEQNKVIYQSAGHPPPLFFDPLSHGDMQQVAGGGIPLGWDFDYTYSPEDNITVSFSDQSLFLFYSDGMLDLQNKSGDSPEYSRFDEEMKYFFPLECPPAFPYQFFNQLEQFGYINRPDDLTLVAVGKCSGGANTLVKAIPPRNKDSIPAFVSEACKFLEKRCSPDSALPAKTELVLAEILHNIAGHGLENNKDKMRPAIFIQLVFEPEEPAVRLSVLDKGKAYESLQQNVRSFNNDIFDFLNNNREERGRGLGIIKTFSRDLLYTRCDTLNWTRLTIPESAGDTES